MISDLKARAVELTAKLLREALRGQQSREKSHATQMARLMDDPAGMAFTFAMADQVFRPPTAARQARRFRDLVETHGVPRYLPMQARLAMRLGEIASRAAPELVMPRVAGKMRAESSDVILPAEERNLSRHLAARRDSGMRMNLNLLGEAVLGEEEARNRLEANIARLADPNIDYISVKISSIFSQIHLVAAEETLATVKDRLRLLYRAAMRQTPAKFVNLDMEEYRDLRLTCDAFQQVLDEPEFHSLEAGIVLQAYLPDAWPFQRELNAWARRRADQGGASIKIRIVKGANLAMERVDAEIHGWPLATYGSKLEVDANFKRMLHEGCLPENARAVRLGIASHNLFDIAYGMLLREREGVEDRVEFEMLEGMANHQARAVRDAADGLLLYAPVVKREDFHSAIAYLIRRLDENTSPENFLHDLFGMEPDDPRWEKQKSQFLSACDSIDCLHSGPHRVQDRETEQRGPRSLAEHFRNEPDTDWSLPRNVAWVRKKVENVRSAPIPLLEPLEVERALQASVSARESWQRLGFTGRGELLARAASTLAARRGEAIAAMVIDADKSVIEADTEVSEAIDFADYYARSFSEMGNDGTRFEPFGTVLVAPPWNFPFAIPCSGVLAALVAGNTVILKPAPETVFTARVLVEALWEAGIPREVLQFLPCSDDEIGKSLVTDERIGAVILTGAYETARMFLGWKPGLRLFAETSGKNALVITAAADQDLAIRDLVKSAFGHAGQKCSAASLAILEAEIYDDPEFRRRLLDAAASLPVGVSMDYRNVVTPLIQQPGNALKRALTTLDPGEEWLLKPRMIDGNPRLWSPGIKLGIAPDCWFRHTECFGPVLGLIRANDLNHAIEIQNASSFGLTGGIHSLDQAEIKIWRERVEVGNAYINRPITGAIVQRQPFGGWKRSCFGPGAKAGGPNYAAQFGTWISEALPEKRLPVDESTSILLAALVESGCDERSLKAAAESDAFWMSTYFGQEHDPSALNCESNVLRYRPVGRVLIRASDNLDSLGRIMLAASASGREVDLSLPEGRSFPAWQGKTFVETESELSTRLSSYGVLRTFPATPEQSSAAVEFGVRLISSAPVLDGRIELLTYFREQAISETLHRHGSLLLRKAPAAPLR